MGAAARSWRHPWAWPLAAASAAPLGAWLAREWLSITALPQGALALAWVLIGAPVLEEAVFRPLLQQALAQRLAPKLPATHAGAAGHTANLLTALVFVGVHWPGRGPMALLWLVPSLALGETWRRTQQLLPCALLHGWFNACLVLASRA